MAVKASEKIRVGSRVQHAQLGAGIVWEVYPSGFAGVVWASALREGVTLAYLAEACTADGLARYAVYFGAQHSHCLISNLELEK